MRMQRQILMGLCGFWLAAAVLAGSQPVAVSPGEASRLARIGDPCPTFSWGEVSGARGYELVVYRLGQDGDEVRPVLRQEFRGTVSGWTPALERCLERGGRYAWAVRALGLEEVTDWSPPSLFQVAAGPSPAEFEAALQVVRSYLNAGAGALPESEVADEGRAEPRSEPEVSASSPPPRAPAGTQLSVEGNVDATSFSGDGSGLANVNAAELDGNQASDFAPAAHPHTVTARPSTGTGTRFSDANCLANEIVTGGGCSCDSGPIHASRPPDGGQGWFCACQDTTTVTATAFCLAVPGP